MVKYGVLGLLIERRGYGYDLVQRLARRLGIAWQLNPSAVYTALDQLEEEGLIEAAPIGAEQSPPSERRQRRAGRVVYQVTELGEAEFRAWLSRPSERVDPIRSELQLKVALAGPDNVPPLLASIAHEEWLIAQHLHEGPVAAGLEEGTRPRNGSSEVELANDLSETSAWSTVAAALVNAAATTRLRGELAWLQAARETLQRMSTRHISAIAHVELPDMATLADTAAAR